MGDTTLKLTSFSMALSGGQPRQPSISPISPAARPILAGRKQLTEFNSCCLSITAQFINNQGQDLDAHAS